MGLGAALFCGLLLVLALPLGEQFYLAWFMLVPLLVAVRGKGFLVGFVWACKRRHTRDRSPK